jgi:hypothetical protein
MRKIGSTDYHARPMGSVIYGKIYILKQENMILII